jgi:ribosomal protein L9
MINKLKPVILVLTQLLFLQGVNGQIPNNITDYLSQRLARYCKSVPREEIFIHSDRQEYISGEDIWFNIYLIDRQSFKPSLNSKIAYFELLNPENLPIVQKRIWLDGGYGPGQITLPDTLSTGTYTIRAYTSWMKNFLPVNCLMKEIKIYNAFSSKTFKRKTYSENFTKGTTLEKNALNARESGLVLTVNNLKEEVLEIFVNTDDKYRSQNTNLFYLAIQTHGIINYIRDERITLEHTKVVIGKNLLTSGINQITIFNAKGQPVCDRFIFTPSREKPVLTLHSDDSTGMRKKVTLDFKLEKRLTSPNLSVSVAPVTNDQLDVDLNDYMVFGTEFGPFPWDVFKDIKPDEMPSAEMDSLLQTVKSNWINWNAILSDDLPVFKYQIEKEDHYLYGKLLISDPKPEDSVRFLVLSMPGKVAGFQYAKTDNEGNFSFKIPFGEESKDLIIQPDGPAKNQIVNIESSFSDQYFKSEKSADLTDLPVPPYISLWSINHQVRKIYGISSVREPKASHIAQVKSKRFYGKPATELIMKEYITLPVMQEVFFELLPGVSLKSKKSGYEISMNDPVNNKPYEVPPVLFVDGVLVNDASLIAAIEPEKVEKIDVVREKYFVGDYLFNGIINIITKAGDFSNVTLPDDAFRMAYKVIDRFGSFISPDYSSEEMKRSRIPDFRNTLYWNPSVKTNKDGNASIEFWTSDFVSDYEINVQGLTPDGKAFGIKKIIKVKRQ